MRLGDWRWAGDYQVPVRKSEASCNVPLNTSEGGGSVGSRVSDRADNSGGSACRKRKVYNSGGEI